MNRLIPAIAAASFALLSGAAFAQAPAGDSGKGPMGGHRMMKPCSQEADPAKCEARRKEMREHMKSAHEACKDSPDRRACMTQQMCAKSADPAKCQERAKHMRERMSKHMDKRQEMAEACSGKRGEALRECYKEQRGKMKPAAPAATPEKKG